jgi:hypothetical protein
LEHTAGGNEDGTAIDFQSRWGTINDPETNEPVGNAHVFAPTFSGSMADMFLEVKIKRLAYPRFVDINLQVIERVFTLFFSNIEQQHMFYVVMYGRHVLLLRALLHHASSCSPV